MKLGVYTAILHDRPLLDSRLAKDDYLAVFADTGVELTGLNVNGNPCTPTRPCRHPTPAS